MISFILSQSPPLPTAQLIPGMLIANSRAKSVNDMPNYLKDPKNVSEDELKNWVDDASVYQTSAGG